MARAGDPEGTAVSAARTWCWGCPAVPRACRPSVCSRRTAPSSHRPAGIDLVAWCRRPASLTVLEDNVRTAPSGVSYVIQKPPSVMTRPDAGSGGAAQRRAARRRGLSRRSAREPVANLAPGGQVAAERSRSLTPGLYNSAFFEHVLSVAPDGHRPGRGPRSGLRRSQSLHEDRWHRPCSRFDVIYPAHRRPTSSTRWCFRPDSLARHRRTHLGDPRRQRLGRGNPASATGNR